MPDIVQKVVWKGDPSDANSAAKSVEATTKKAFDNIAAAVREYEESLKGADAWLDKAMSNARVDQAKRIAERVKMASTSLDEFGDSTGKAGASLVDMEASMRAAARRALIMNEAIQLGKAAIRGIVDQFKAGHAAAREYEQTNIRLGTALEQQGLDSEKLTQELNNQSAALESITNVSDEVIRNHQSLAISMGASADQASDFSAAAIALANATGKSVNEAILQLTKTLGGYGGELSEVIPEVKNLTTEELQAGKAAELINNKFGKFLTLEKQGLSGAINSLSVGWDNVAEALAKASREWDGLNKIISAMGDALNGVAQTIESQGALGGVGALIDIALFGGEHTASLLESQKAIELSRKLAEQQRDAMLDAFALKSGEFDFSVLSEQFAEGFAGATGFVVGAPEKRKEARSKKSGAFSGFDFRGEDLDIFGVEAEERRLKGLQEAQELYDKAMADHLQRQLDFQIELTNKKIGEKEKLVEAEKKAAEEMIAIAEKEMEARERIMAKGASTIESIASGLTNTLLDNIVRMAEGERVAWDQVVKQFLKGTGMRLVGQGTSDLLTGASRTLGSYGADATGEALLALGAAEVGIGAAMIGGSLAISGSGASAGGGGGGVGGASALWSGGNGGGIRRDEPVDGGTTTINVYGAISDEHTARLIEEAQKRKMQVGR